MKKLHISLCLIYMHIRSYIYKIVHCLEFIKFAKKKKKKLEFMRAKERDMFYCMNNMWLFACNSLDIWFTAWITIGLLHVFFLTIV